MPAIRIQLTAEENIIRKIMMQYTRNSTLQNIDISKYSFDNAKFIEAVKRCKIAGIVYNMINNHKTIINMPSDLCCTISEMYEESRKRAYEAATAINHIMALARKNSAQCMVAGDYVIMNEVCGWGEFFVDELLFYTDREIGLSDLPNRVNCKCVLKEPEFFAQNYSNCKLINEAPLEVIYKEMLSEITAIKTLNDTVIKIYLLHMEYIDRYNSVYFDKWPYHNEVIDNIFAVI